MKEIWRDIKEFRGYKISNLGRVKSPDYYVEVDGKFVLYRQGKILHQQKNKKTGYLSVGITNKSTIMVHRLVANAFIKNPNNLPCINHKDENKQNNRVDNLEWCTHKYNNNYGENTKKLCKPVLQYDLKGNFIKEYYGASEASRQLGINCTNICKCCRGERMKTKGFVFKYKEKEGKI